MDDNELREAAIVKAAEIDQVVADITDTVRQVSKGAVERVNSLVQRAQAGDLTGFSKRDIRCVGQLAMIGWIRCLEPIAIEEDGPA